LRASCRSTSMDRSRGSTRRLLGCFAFCCLARDGCAPSRSRNVASPREPSDPASGSISARSRTTLPGSVTRAHDPYQALRRASRRHQRMADPSRRARPRRWYHDRLHRSGARSASGGGEQGRSADAGEKSRRPRRIIRDSRAGHSPPHRVPGVVCVTPAGR
jgi:hypothetical protein